MNYLFICYPGCSTCKKAKKWLDNRQIDYIERNIKQDNPSENELYDWFERSNYPIKNFFNTSGKLYKDMSIKDKLPTLSKEEAIQLLSTNGMLIKRPLVIGKNVVLVGFREKDWEEILANK